MITTTRIPHPDWTVSKSESPLLLKRRPISKAIPIITKIKCITTLNDFGEF